MTDRIKTEARRLGFERVGVCPAVTPTGVSHLATWLARGYAGQMHYLAERQAAYEHPRSILDGARSLVMVAMNYRTREPRAPSAGHGRVARYAWGDDYHDVIHNRLRALKTFAQEQAPDARFRGVVDTAPLLEGEFAARAGLGWIGKNTLLLNQQLGSWFFLAALLTDLELEFDEPNTSDHCGSCRACLDACPTGAFVDAYQLDARRCISYLTIELRDSIPRDLRTDVGDWLFGCDVCQDVCPWNHDSPVSDSPDLQPTADVNPLELLELFGLDDEAFRRRFRHTPLWRAKRRGILRNAAIVLGNQRHAAAQAALARGLADAEALVRSACAWALGQLDTSDARRALLARLKTEDDPEVIDEVRLALEY